MIFFFSRRRPAVISFRVNDAGIGVGKNFYEHDRFEDFAVRSRAGHLDEIFLKKKTAVSPYLRIPIDSKMGKEVCDILKIKLPEVEYKESLVELFSEILGF